MCEKAKIPSHKKGDFLLFYISSSKDESSNANEPQTVIIVIFPVYSASLSFTARAFGVAPVVNVSSNIITCFL